MRFLISHQPAMFLPARYSLDFCRLVNRDNGSTITGEGGDNIGRGDRTTIYFVDEAAFIERSSRVEAALSQTSRCKIWVSTPNGMGNAFYRKRMGGALPVFTYTWRHDPRKTESWYQAQKAALDPVTLAQEVDIDYAASIENLCIPARWVASAVDLLARYPQFASRAPVHAAYDIAGGPGLNVLGFRRGIEVLEIQSWGDTNPTTSARKVRDECARRHAAHLNYDSGGGYAEAISALLRDERERERESKFQYRGGPAPFTSNALNGAHSPSDNIWPDGHSAHEKFHNGLPPKK